MASLLDEPGIAVHPDVREFVGARRLLFIDGALTDSRDGHTFESFDPATGGTLARVAEARDEDIDLAVASAQRALDGPWGRMSPADRGLLLTRLADAIEDRAEVFAQLDSLDNGKPVANARAGDIPLAIDHFRYFAGWPTKIEGRTFPTSVPNMHAYSRYEPVGVVGAIGPWNFPLVLAAWKLAPALAAGCTVVLKPAEQTPLSALLLGELLNEVGFPPGTVNVCPGFGELAGAALVRHPGVAKIAFTGSLEVGRQVAAHAAPTLKHVSLELGGKSPNIIFGDADLEAAAAAAASAIFGNTGQVCSAGSRLMVQHDAYDEVVERVGGHAQELRMGPGLRPETTLGPLVSSAQHERVRGYIEKGIAEGAVVAHGDGDETPGEGYFVGPTVLTGVPDDAVMAREEIFGPVLVVQPFDSLDEVAERANANQYGLAAGIWTRHVGTAHLLAARLQAGTVWINCYNCFDASVPFGGVKASGYGRDSGREALEKFLSTKAVWTSLE
jgi:acyl-CoA reductase-like NAD-dependent aldehyde dehydrogenase